MFYSRGYIRIPTMKKHLYNVQVWSKQGGRYVHTQTARWSVPYPIAQSIKKNMEANDLAHFQFIKIVKA